MKQLCIFVFSFFVSYIGFGQESLEAIQFQARGTKIRKLPTKATNTIDSTFNYTFDTITLPVFDEFSKSKFQDKTANPGDPNVSEVLYHRLTDVSNIPLPPNAVYSASITKRRTTSSGVTTDTDLSPITIQVANFQNVPVVYSTVQAYPPYFIYDTLDFVNDPDTVYVVAPDYTQDSARIFTAALTGQNFIWTDNSAYHNFTHAVNPWSLGVVTFDGLDEFGYPYNFGSSSVGYADALTSKAIDLSSNVPGDSIYLSFLVQTKGFGDEPEVNDSLVLEFYDATGNEWDPIWSKVGGPLADFEVGHIKVTQADYLTSGFRFRFKNYGGLSGMLDEFHLDYVNLRAGSGYQDTLFKDFAFVYPIGSLLETYTQVPWDHWINDPTHMNPTVNVTVRNGSNIPENNLNGSVEVKYSGITEGNFVLIGQELSGNNPNYAPRTVYSTFHDFSAGYSFSTTPQTSKTFEVVGAVTAQFASLPQNDTSYTQQIFANEYAYDDGSAEAAYGVTGNQARLAYRFVPYEADTLIGVKMSFVPSVNDVSNKLFLLTVWDDNGGVPGNVIYEDDFFYPRQPVYEEDRGVFTDYYLKDTALALPNAPFYVGWRQIDANRLNIGFDRNNDASTNTFFSLNGGASWTPSTLEGSMLMRPVFSTTANFDLGIVASNQASQWSVYPNPTEGMVSIDWLNNEPFPGATVRDAQGRIVLQLPAGTTQMDLTSFPSGIYFVHLNGETGNIKKVFR